MIAFIKGVVVDRNDDMIIIDHHGMGFQIITAHPYTYELDKEILVYTFQHVREDAIVLFGFKTKEEYQLFIRLIGVKGLGGKSVINMLNGASADQIIQAITNADIAFLKKMPGIGAKTAQQIVLDLKGKLVPKDTEIPLEGFLEDAVDALQALGYKPSEIRPVMTEVAKSAKNVDEAIRLALTLLNKRK